MTNYIHSNEARVNITYGGSNGDLPDTVYFDATDAQVRSWVSEALRAGSVPGIPKGYPDLRDYVIDRFQANRVRPYHLIQVRPKTPFG